MEYRCVVEWPGGTTGYSHGDTEDAARKSARATLAYDHAQKEGAVVRVQRRDVGAWDDVEVRRAGLDHDAVRDA